MRGLHCGAHLVVELVNAMGDSQALRTHGRRAHVGHGAACRTTQLGCGTGVCRAHTCLHAQAGGWISTEAHKRRAGGLMLGGMLNTGEPLVQHTALCSSSQKRVQVQCTKLKGKMKAGCSLLA